MPVCNRCGRSPEKCGCRRIFDLLGARRGDTLDDLFPGTGIVGRAWEQFTSDDDEAA